MIIINNKSSSDDESQKIEQKESKGSSSSDTEKEEEKETKIEEEEEEKESEDSKKFDQTKKEAEPKPEPQMENNIKIDSDKDDESAKENNKDSNNINNNSSEYLNCQPFPNFISSSSSSSDENENIEISIPNFPEFKPKTLKHQENPAPATQPVKKPAPTLKTSNVQFAPPQARKFQPPHIQINRGQLIPAASQQIPELITPLNTNKVIDSKSDSVPSSDDLVHIKESTKVAFNSQSNVDDKINGQPPKPIVSSFKTKTNDEKEKEETKNKIENETKEIKNDQQQDDIVDTKTNVDDTKKEDVKSTVVAAEKQKKESFPRPSYEMKRTNTSTIPIQKLNFPIRQASLSNMQTPLSPTPPTLPPVPISPTLQTSSSAGMKPFPLGNVKERSGSEHWNEGEGDFSSDGTDDEMKTSSQMIQNDDNNKTRNDSGKSLLYSSNNNSSFIGMNLKSANNLTSNSVSNFNVTKSESISSFMIRQNQRVPQSASKPTNLNQNNLINVNINNNNRENNVYSQPEKIKLNAKKEKIQELFAINKSMDDININVENDDIEKYMDAADAKLRKLFTVDKIDDRPLETTKWQLTKKANAAEKSYESLNENMKELEEKFESVSEVFESAQSKVMESNEKIQIVQRKFEKLSSKIGKETEVKDKITDFTMLILINTFTFIVWLYYAIRRFAMSFYMKSDQLPRPLSLKEVGHRVENIQNHIDESRQLEIIDVE